MLVLHLRPQAPSDHLVNAWHHTYGLPVVLTNCSNNYGPWQFPEKLIPVVILKALAGESIPLNGCGFNVRRLILMELRMKEVELGNLKWDGPVALIWGADSHHNPFSAAHRPSSRRLAVLKKALPIAYSAVIRNRIKRVFTGGVDISIVPGVHGAFFQSANTEGLAAAIQKHMGSPAKK